ncbi:helix-turn-helix domain-containing protein [Acinetobacter courvalinii]|uniref:hypothetical protein n=1 Tax=Acinetobacter courvalinii TaxID=280147 RepID=UPI0021D1224C|nr:hypothetical protein [Acinetobacter courvalinii]
MYLNIMFEENDPALIAHALSVIAEARDTTQIVNEAGIWREALYKRYVITMRHVLISSIVW